MYNIAAGLSLALCLVLLIFVRFRPGARLARGWASTILLLSTALFISGFGPALPAWTTVIGTNILLLSVGPILYSAFLAHCSGRPSSPDWLGWTLVVLAAPAFWYWGIVEPNGIFRSMVFSLAASANNFRTAVLLWRATEKKSAITAIRGMSTLFAALALWMAIRFMVLLGTEPPPPDLQGVNPTTWKTVFGYILFVSAMTINVMWLETGHLKNFTKTEPLQTGRLSGFVDYFSNKLLLIWSALIVLIIGVASAFSIGYISTRDTEKSRQFQNARVLNEAFVEHTAQTINQADTILHAVRGFYQKTASLPATESFIRELGFNRNIIDNIYLIASDGRIVISHNPEALGRSVADRDYFHALKNSADDRLFIASVEPGRVTGQLHFRITRRLTNPDGSFAGLVLATINPEAFVRYYRDLMPDRQNVASLLGIADRKLRARSPVPPVDQWNKPVDSPIWDMLKKSPAGQYENISQVDNIRRWFVYQQVGKLPLVMVTGFSDDNLQQGVRKRLVLLVGTTLTVLLFTLMLALLLTVEAKRREEHQQATALLEQSGQRLLEAQAIGRIGDWELDLLTGAVNYSDQLLDLAELSHEKAPKSFADMRPLYHPDDLPEIERCLREWVEHGSGGQLDVRIKLPDGRFKWFRYIGKTLRDNQGNVTKMFGTTQDIDKDKRMELELKSLNENLQQRVEEEMSRRIASEGLMTHHAKMAAMGEMIGAIAHQWRQPLSTVSVIFQNLLAARRLNRLDEAYLEKAANDATALISHMSSTIDSFRNFFRPEKTREQFHALDKIHDAAGFIRSQLRSNNITLLLPEQCGSDCTINGFPNEFVQVMLNLLANARDAILDKRRADLDNDDSITITVQPEDSTIIIEVTDTGCGIPEHAAPRIFEPYFTTKEEGQGTGIGLYMSRQIIEESMGGKLTFTSRPGSTTFRIELPNA
ncbi:MAG: GHKL domain-containing protein [Geobacter sp.]|nr:GHKL domain-containing protein [Geobacter sp.]